MHPYDSHNAPLDDYPDVTHELPRLGIRHLMLWILCTSAYMALFRGFSEASFVEEEFKTAIRVQVVLGAMLTGASLAGAVVLVHERRRRGPPLASEPGHWLLIADAATLLLNIPVTVVFFLSYDEMDELISATDRTFVWSQVYFGVVSFVPLVVYLAAGRASETLRWKWIFRALALFTTVQIARAFVHVVVIALAPARLGSIDTAMTTIGMGIALGIAVVSALDLAIGARRDWLHWAGVTTRVAWTVVSVASMTVLRLMT